jgi:hypothetical protein
MRLLVNEFALNGTLLALVSLHRCWQAPPGKQMRFYCFDLAVSMETAKFHIVARLRCH